MGLSKHYIDTQREAHEFSPERLAVELRARVPGIIFAYVMGSSAGCVVRPHGDLDLAVYIEGEPSLELYETVQEVVDEVVGPVRCDLGILNRAEPIFRFEALKGRLLFSRDEELRISFYSLTCREYEHQMFDYEKQRRYRMEARKSRRTEPHQEEHGA